MRQILRLYMRHDLDLIGLRMQGIHVAKLGKMALEAYANNHPIKVRIPPGKAILSEELSHFMNKNGEPLTKTSRAGAAVSFKCEFTTHDPAAEKLLRGIKNTYRSLFIKTLIRNTLLEQSLIPFFTQTEDTNRENMRLSSNPTLDITEIPLMNNKINPKDYLKPAKPIIYPEEKSEVKDETKSVEVNDVFDEVPDEELTNISDTLVSPITELNEEEINETLADTSTDDIEAMFASLMNDL